MTGHRWISTGWPALVGQRGSVTRHTLVFEVIADKTFAGRIQVALSRKSVQGA